MKHLCDILENAASLFPNKNAFVYLNNQNQQESITYLSLTKQAQAIGNILKQTLPNTSSNESPPRVFLIYDAGLDFIKALFGCLYAGFIAIPIVPPITHAFAAKLLAIKKDASPIAFLTNSSARQEKWFSLLSDMQGVYTDECEIEEGGESTLHRDNHAIAILQYTSGSTGNPKGVVLSHHNLIANLEWIAQQCKSNPENVFVHWLPHFHDLGLIQGILQPIFKQFTAMFFSPNEFIINPLCWLETISKYQADRSIAPNFAYDLCSKRITEEQKNALNLSSWRIAGSGAEPIRAKTFKRFADAFKVCGFNPRAFFPCYGLAENTLLVSSGKVNEGTKVCLLDSTSLQQNRVVFASKNERAYSLSETFSQDSKMLENTYLAVSSGYFNQKDVLVVDPIKQERSAHNQIGEIWVKGDSVAQGYYNKPELNQSVFKAMTANGEGPFLRTGDLGFIKDNELYVTGRIKDLIIIDGRNYYPQDIEEVVEETNNEVIRPSCVVAFSKVIDEQEVLIILAECKKPLADPLYQQLSEQIFEAIYRQVGLHTYSVVLLPPRSLEKTSSGKIKRRWAQDGYDNKSLPKFYEQVRSHIIQPDTSISFQQAKIEPRNELEKILARIWAQVFKVNLSDVGIYDHFFISGGFSLLAGQFCAQVESVLSKKLPLSVLFENPTIADLSKYLTDRKTEVQPATIKTNDLSKSIPLSFSQQSLWLDEFHLGSYGIYDIPFAIKLNGNVNQQALLNAFRAIVKRHEMLRTEFKTNAEGVAEQFITDYHDSLVNIDVQVLEEGTELIAWLQRNKQTLDLKSTTLFNIQLIQCNKLESILFIHMHHIITDGWSINVLIQELTRFYDHFDAKQQFEMTPLTFQYKDFSLWQREWLQQATFEQQLTVWHTELANIPHPPVGINDKSRPIKLSYQTQRVSLQLNADMVNALRAFAEKNQVSLFMVLLTNLYVLLHRYTLEKTLVVGSPAANRNQAGLDQLIGFFVNIMPLKIEIDPNATFNSLLNQVKTTCLAAYERQSVPFDKIVEILKLPRLPNQQSIFQVMFVMQDFNNANLNFSKLEANLIDIPTNQSRYDLTISVYPSANAIIDIHFDYASNLFSLDRINHLAKHYNHLLVQALNAPQETIAALTICSIEEQKVLLNQWNQSKPLIQKHQNIHEQFESIVKTYPEQIALVDDSLCMSYQELNDKANQLARYLINQGVKAESLVVISMERSADLIISILAVLKAGGAYVPLDPSYPNERMTFVINESQSEFLLTQFHLTSLFCDFKLTLVSVDKLWTQLAGFDKHDLNRKIPKENLAYVIYTSGSTGTPKGVMVEHAQVLRLFVTTQEQINFAASDCWALFHSYSFDFSVWEIFGALLHGAKLVIVPFVTSRSPEDFCALINHEQVTLLNLTPSAFRLILTYMKSASVTFPESLRAIIFGGEALNPTVFEDWAQIDPKQQINLINMYGITETTVHVTYQLITDMVNKKQWDQINIG